MFMCRSTHTQKIEPLMIGSVGLIITLTVVVSSPHVVYIMRLFNYYGIMLYATSLIGVFEIARMEP